MAAEADLRLAGEFPPTEAAAWRALVARGLARAGLTEGADPIEALSTTTYDGIRLLPLYTAADAPGAAAAGLPGAPPFVRGAATDPQTSSGWDVRALHADPDPARTRAAVLADLERGATSLWLRVGPDGLAVDDLGAALAGVYLDLAPIVLDAGGESVEAARAVLSIAGKNGVDRGELRGSFGADPVGLEARTGRRVDAGTMRELVTLARGTGMCLATVDATIYSDAGARDVDEIGIATAVGVSYLRALVDAGFDVDAALRALEFRFAVTADQFAGIAKLRAARRVWDRVAELSGAAADRRGQRQHAVTSAVMLTQRDPWTNLLRTTVACFAAAVGGAEAITVLPFDAAIGLPDEHARRLARNTSAILHDESSLGRVVDAAGGSWYVEAYTDALADRAWEAFTAIERAGGAEAALRDGLISDLIAGTRAARARDVATRRAPITGVSEFALPDEPALVRLPAPARSDGGPLAPVRWAGEYERLRALAERSDPRPTVFLAALGPRAAYAARLGFATNLFNAGGLGVVVATEELDEIAAHFAGSGAAVACLCSSDDVYAQRASDAAASLRSAGARFVWLAGKPAAAEDCGVDGYLYAGCDALDVLRTALDVSGVAV